MERLKLYSLSFETTKDYYKNLELLVKQIKEIGENSLILASEVCLTGYDYDNFEAMLEINSHAKEVLKTISTNKIISLSMLEKTDNGVFNFAYIFYNGEIVHKQAKAKLFKFGDEDKYMACGDQKDIKIVEVAGLKIGILICFELRFKELWQQLEGADIILIPAWWGKLREQNFITLTNALAIINQCYVVASDSKVAECTGQSGIINPFGVEQRNGNKPCLEVRYDKKEIKKMRKYMDVGIK